MSERIRRVPWVHTDSGSYASGSEDDDGCTINALANYLGQPFEEVRQRFDKEIRDQKFKMSLKEPEPVYFRIWRRVYSSYGLVPVSFDRVVGLEEIRDTYGDCVLHVAIPSCWASEWTHCSALVGGKLLDWFDSRMWVPIDAWVPKDKAKANKWCVSKVGQRETHRKWSRDMEKLFEVPIDDYIRWAKSRARRKK